MNTKLFESYNQYLNENETSRNIIDLRNELENLDWNNNRTIEEQIPEYLKPMITKLKKLLDSDYFEDEDMEYDWIVKNLIKLGYSKEDIEQHENELIDVLDYLENLCY